MMTRMLMVGGIFIGALVQMFLPAWPMFGGAKPPVLAAFVLYYALHRSPRGMWIAVFWAALLYDGLDLGTFGPALLAFPIMGSVVQRIRLEIFVDGTVTHMVCGALGAMFVAFLTILVYAINGQRPLLFGNALLRIMGSGLLGLATLPLVSLVMGKLEGALPQRRGYGWQ